MIKRAVVRMRATAVCRPNAYHAPALAYFGGQLVMNGGFGSFDQSADVLTMTTTSWSTAAWQTYTANNGPAARNGHRVVIFGGIMYYFGGCVRSAPHAHGRHARGLTHAWRGACRWDTTQYYNDVWGLDLTSTLAAGTSVPASWVNIVANGRTDMPAARDMFSFDVYGHDLVIFGGFSHNSQVVDPTRQCTPAAQCVFYNDVWIWRPGNVGASGLTPVPNSNAGWTRLQPSGPTPPGR